MSEITTLQELDTKNIVWYLSNLELITSYVDKKNQKKIQWMDDDRLEEEKCEKQR